MTIQAQPQKICDLFTSKKITFAAAESCTGGKLTSELVMIPGASSYIKGGVVAYSNDVKVHILGVKETTLSAVGAVSKEVALEMAKGVKKKLESTWSVGITGIAGPAGGSSDKPVGTVCVAVCGPSFEYVETNLFTGSRGEIIESSVKRAMHLILEKVTK